MADSALLEAQRLLQAWRAVEQEAESIKTRATRVEKLEQRERAARAAASDGPTFASRLRGGDDTLTRVSAPQVRENVRICDLLRCLPLTVRGSHRPQAGDVLLARMEARHDRVRAMREQREQRSGGATPATTPATPTRSVASSARSAAASPGAMRDSTTRREAPRQPPPAQGEPQTARPPSLFHWDISSRPAGAPPVGDARGASELRELSQEADVRFRRCSRRRPA